MTASHTYALAFGYEGNGFMGWQIQPHGPSVQARMEEALGVLCGGPTKIYASGRTDSGVHALQQVAHFHAAPGLETERFRRSLNALLRPQIVVQQVVKVPPSFHARHSATKKTYRYHLYTQPYPPLFGSKQCWWVRPELHLAGMEQAAAAWIGQHDFSAFRAKACGALSPVREVYSIQLKRVHWAEVFWGIEVSADGFLQHMMRILVGTLVEIGLGRLQPEAAQTILEAKNRCQAGMTAPAHGLYLVGVDYDLGEFPSLTPFLAYREPFS